ncbi:MAG: tRNA (adenine-N(6)-)-methyltransferase [Bacteroidetes bacterium]|nr:MAG: tRNA (adenine-N(6)-)-methyltransferase [Bacteroidota bacterium]
MTNQYFKFKQFTINQNNCAMKVGTDGVLIGAWVDCEGSTKILDIGAGTGLISLMMAQRSKAVIDAIEIDNNSFFQAKENILNSDWENRINIFNISFQNFQKNKSNIYDLIVTNPPYFINSLKANTPERTNARHNNLLTHSELLSGVDCLLTKEGVFCLILPYEQTQNFIKLANNYGLYCNKILKVKPTLNKEPKRALIELRREKIKYEENVLIIEKDKRHDYTKEYKELTKDYYLAF